MNVLSAETDPTTTVELSTQEVLEALCLYVGDKLGVCFKADATLNISASAGEMRTLFSFTRREFVGEPV